ncbi:copper resistance CopC/CopD family protein [Rhodococcus sp. NPDC003318]|uniref:copper resistance CopC/CopD family protein n=1 Tax=Rhodococcus sp. NPDC003318 TaxID=3364503 RepID=UPI00367BF0F8
MATRARTRIGAFLWLLLVVAATAVWAAAPASAHAAVVATTPTDGAHADTAPTTLSFDLNEPVTLVEGSAQLIDSAGGLHAFSAQRLEDGGRRIVLVVDGELADEAYLATARVISADTHVVSLSTRFTVGSVTQFGETLEAGTADSAVEQYLGYPIKTAVYLGLVLSAGLLISGRWVWPDTVSRRRFRLVYRVGAALLVVGLLGRFTVQVAQQAGGLDAVSASAAATVLGSRLGVALVVAAVLGALVLVFPPGRGRVPNAVGYAQAGAGIAAVTLGGHGGATETWPLSFVGTAIHVYAAAVWLGGVAVLLLVLDEISGLRRWHRIATGHVVLVVLAGVILAVVQVRPFGALIRTPYGLVLILKVVLVALLVTAGATVYRRHRERPAGAAGDAPRQQTRSRILIAEAALGVAVLAVTSVLSSVTPAKESYTTDVRTELDFGASEVLDVQIDSVRRGPRTMTVHFRIPATDAEDPDVTVELSSATANVARMPVELTRSGPDGDVYTWRSEGLIVPAAGAWKVTVRFDGSHGPKVASFGYEAL